MVSELVSDAVSTSNVIRPPCDIRVMVERASNDKTIPIFCPEICVEE
jgi:hypothetical protein